MARAARGLDGHWLRATAEAPAHGRAGGRASPLQGGKLEALEAELDEGPQVGLADPADGVDVRAGAVVLGQVAQEAAARERAQGCMRPTPGAAGVTHGGPGTPRLAPPRGPRSPSLAHGRGVCWGCADCGSSRGWGAASTGLGAACVGGGARGLGAHGAELGAAGPPAVVDEERPRRGPRPSPWGRWMPHVPEQRGPAAVTTLGTRGEALTPDSWAAPVQPRRPRSGTGRRGQTGPQGAVTAEERHRGAAAPARQGREGPRAQGCGRLQKLQARPHSPLEPRGPSPSTPLKNTPCSRLHQGSEEMQPTHLPETHPLRRLRGQQKSHENW